MTGIAHYSIRRAEPGDATGILACLGSAFEPYRRDYTPGAFEDTVLTRETIQQRLAEMCVFVAVSEAGEIVGTIACQLNAEGEGHLRGMAVLPESQGSGVAAVLLRTAEAWLRERDCRRITLDTTRPLRRAIRFYVTNGFRASGLVRDFFGMELFEYAKTLTA